MGAGVNLADVFELMADAVGDRTALVAGEHRYTYAELDARADRAARLLRRAGVGPGDHVGVYAVNRAEWVETLLAGLKLRAVPININYRYVAAELRYLVDNADLAAIVVERRYLPTLAEVLPDVTPPRAIVVLADGTDPATSPDLAASVGPGGVVEFEDDPGDTGPVRIDRDGDDNYIIYTGGTTGMPKGVVWRSEDLFFAAIGRPLPDGRLPTQASDLLAHAANPPLRYMVLAPLMHGAAQLGALISFATAGTAVLWTGRTFDPVGVLELAARERVTSLTVVGDAMAHPLVDALEAEPDRYDLSGLLALSSSGAPLSDPIRARVRALLPHVFVIDSYGATEMGHNGQEAGQPRVFRLSDDTAVLDEKLEPVAPGSGDIGRIARRGSIPLRYHKDPEKTAATFLFDARGVRWVVPGDLATVEEDGTARLLGRGSTVINTGGEKVYPEEVENALKSFPDVADVVVVGAPDERYGERVVALVVPDEGTAALDVAALGTHCRSLVAGYKAPKEIHLLPVLTRSPAGKIDMRWARETAARLAGATPTPTSARP